MVERSILKHFSGHSKHQLIAVVVTCTKRDLGLGGGLVEEKQVSRRGKGIREVIGAEDDHWHSI